VVRKRVRGDPEQPGHHGYASPLKASDRAQRLLEYMRRDVFGNGPAFRTATHERVDPVDVPLVDLDKPGRIGLCRLNEKPVVFGGLRQSEPRVLLLVTAEERGKLWSE